MISWSAPNSSLTRYKGLNPVSARRAAVQAEDRQAATRRAPLKPVSDKRRAENRERRAMIVALYAERPQCARPGCPHLADDLHEPLTRARGGSIADPENQLPLCRRCHDEVTFRPESELGWAYEAKILIHSWEVQR